MTGSPEWLAAIRAGRGFADIALVPAVVARKNRDQRLDYAHLYREQKLFRCADQSALNPQEINRIEALVTRAAALVESKGKAAAFAEFGKRDSEWWHGDTYLSGYELDGNVLLNPAVPSRVGTNPHDEKDKNGKAFHHELIEMALVNGFG